MTNPEIPQNPNDTRTGVRDFFATAIEVVRFGFNHWHDKEALIQASNNLNNGNLPGENTETSPIPLKPINWPKL